MSAQPPPPIIERDPLDVKDLVDILLLNLPNLMSFMREPRNKVGLLPTTNGLQESLGTERLRISELLLEMIRVNYECTFQPFENEHVCADHASLSSRF